MFLDIETDKVLVLNLSANLLLHIQIMPSFSLQSRKYCSLKHKQGKRSSSHVVSRFNRLKSTFVYEFQTYDTMR
jgi:hypothetical protein